MSGRRNESSVWKSLSVVFGILLFCLIVFMMFLYTSLHVSKLDPEETKAEQTDEFLDEETVEVNRDFEGFTMTVGIAAVPAPKTDTSTAPSLPQEETTETTDSSYLCPESSTAYLTTIRVDELTRQYAGTMPDGKSVPQMIINEIYAKNGYRFKNQVLQAYYDAKPWYSGYISDMQTVSNKLNAVEKANVDFLRKHYTG